MTGTVRWKRWVEADAETLTAFTNVVNDQGMAWEHGRNCENDLLDARGGVMNKINTNKSQHIFNNQSSYVWTYMWGPLGWLPPIIIRFRSELSQEPKLRSPGSHQHHFDRTPAGLAGRWFDPPGRSDGPRQKNIEQQRFEQWLFNVAKRRKTPPIGDHTRPTSGQSKLRKRSL